jgi:hypothetical protein
MTMKDSRLIVQIASGARPTEIIAKADENAGRRVGASSADMLLYISDLLAELKALAAKAHCDRVAALLADAQRETERQVQALRQDEQKTG